MIRRTIALAAVVLATVVCAEGGAPVRDGDDIEVLDEALGKVVTDESRVTRRADGFKFTEGPAWLPGKDAFVFSDIPADVMYLWKPGGKPEVFRKPSHHANGNVVDRKGRLITCHHGSRVVTRRNEDGQIETIAKACKGGRFNSPNDAAVKRDGTIWFTDPTYGLAKRRKEQPKNYVFRLDPGADEPVVVADDFSMPNGLCFSPDDGKLYIADSDPKVHHVRVFELRKDNTLGEGKLFATIRPGVPDGMRCDADGRLYVSAGDGVQVFSPKGKLLGKLRTPKAAANCSFGGADFRTLLITARDAIYTVELAVKGDR